MTKALAMMITLAMTPGAATAASYAFADLQITRVTPTVIPGPATTGTFSIFSDTSATFLGLGQADARSVTIPGTADALQSRQGTAQSPTENDFAQRILLEPGSRSDATITATTPGDVVAASIAESHVLAGADNFASASSGNRLSLGFRLRAGTVVTVSVDYTREFDLSTDFFGETAVGSSSVTATLTRAGTSVRVPVTISGFRPSESNAVSNGDSFSLTDGGTILFTFASIASAGDYTLNVEGRTTTDVRSVPTAPAIALFALGLVAIGLRSRRSV